MIIKADLVDDDRLAFLTERLTEINPAAEQLGIRHGEIYAERLIAKRLPGSDNADRQAKGWHGAAACFQMSLIAGMTPAASNTPRPLLGPACDALPSRHGEQILSFWFIVGPLQPRAFSFSH